MITVIVGVGIAAALYAIIQSLIIAKRLRRIRHALDRIEATLDQLEA